MLTVAALHHIADPVAVRQTLGEMVRVAAPGGRVVVWDHNPRNPYWKLLMARVPQDTGEERLVPEAEVLAGLRGAGARVLLSSQLGLVPDFVPRARSRSGRGARAARRAEPTARGSARTTWCWPRSPPSGAPRPAT